jgi:hypothetical protein
VPHACCLLNHFTLFYAEITPAGSLNPVTSLIPHHRPDWLFPMAGLLIRELLFRGVIEKILIVTPGGWASRWSP